MNALRPLNLCRNIFKTNVLLKNVLATSNTKLSTIQHTRLLCRSRQYTEFQKPILLLSLNRKLLCTNAENKLENNGGPISKPINSSTLSNWKRDIAPYARLMRIDRPIGKLFEIV